MPSNTTKLASFTSSHTRGSHAKKMSGTNIFLEETVASCAKKIRILTGYIDISEKVLHSKVAIGLKFRPVLNRQPLRKMLHERF
jgi:hypothetical protein